MASGSTALALGLVLVLPLAGCATNGRVQALERRVDELETRLIAVSERAEAAELAAQKAAAQSKDAEDAAAFAAQRAHQAARTTEVIFKHRVPK
jgi:hypothetical protein